MKKILQGLFVSPEKAKAYAEFEEALANLRKATGDGRVSAQVLVDALSERFTEEPTEIANILYRYASAGGNWPDLNRYIFSHPITYYKGKNISLESCILKILNMSGGLSPFK